MQQKKLTIAQIAPPQNSVPPKKYGGIELMTHLLTEELVKRGHKVYLFASADSKTSAELIPVYENTIIQSDRPEDRDELERLKLLGINNTLQAIDKLKDKIDIVHHQWSMRLYKLWPKDNPPLVSTIHYNLHDKNIRDSYVGFENFNYVSISDNQRKGMPELNYIQTVHHGIDASVYEFSEKKGDYFAFLGRIWPDKGPKEAILAAKKAGVKLKIAARVDFGRAQDYFKKEIEPLIDGQQIQFIGEVNLKEKSDFLKDAIALVSPIQWEEPFGLIFIEAMACGTPVVSFARGAAPEIIADKKTGFLCQKGNMEELANALQTLASMSEDEYLIMRQNARQHVLKNFSVEKMTDEYEQAYRKILEEKTP